nr:retrotransposon protein, putative, Ty1-copia subclass [Tanacetum cinerariifolium]
KNKQQTVGASSSTPQVMAIQGGRVQKKAHGKAKGKGKAKGGQYSYPSKTKKPQPQKKERPTKEGQCHHSKEGLKGARKLKRGSLYLYVGNGLGAKVEAIGSFDLHLPNGLIIVLDNCHYAPTITRGKMTKNPFSYKTEKVNDVIGLIHTDVCSPLRHVSKKGASYFITFTDDYSRYGYVYLLKHKHEVFETFKVWGCEAHVKRHTADKLEQRSIKYFLEIEFILQKESGRIIDTKPCKNTSEHPIEAEKIVPDQLYFNVEVEEYSLGDKGELASYKAALSDPEFEKWLVAMNAEIQSMYDNKVWKLVDLPPGAKVVKSKWIYKKKTNMDGVVYIYKARLVAKGFTQTYGVDYEETFSPVADIRAIRILIAIAAYYDYEIWQIDMKKSIWYNLKVLLILIIPERLKKDQEKDKIGSKPDKNGKRGEAERRLKQLQ